MQFVVAFLYHTTEEDIGEYFLLQRVLESQLFWERIYVFEL